MISQTTANELLRVFRKYVDPACYQSIAEDLSKIKGNKSFKDSIQLVINRLDHK